MRELTLKIYFSDEATELSEDREGFMAGFGEGFTLADLLQRTDGTFTGCATHVGWEIRDVEAPADDGRTSEIDSAACPSGVFID